jgi:hypothetical protein
MSIGADDAGVYIAFFNINGWEHPVSFTSQNRDVGHPAGGSL